MTDPGFEPRCVWLQSRYAILSSRPSGTPLESRAMQPRLEGANHGWTLPPTGPTGGERPGLLPGAGSHRHRRTGCRPPRGHSCLPAALGAGGRSSLLRDGPHRSSRCPHIGGGSRAHSGCRPGMAGMAQLQTEKGVTLKGLHQPEGSGSASRQLIIWQTCWGRNC